jgi:hypothetical protein
MDDAVHPLAPSGGVGVIFDHCGIKSISQFAKLFGIPGTGWPVRNCGSDWVDHAGMRTIAVGDQFTLELPDEASVRPAEDSATLLVEIDHSGLLVTLDLLDAGDPDAVSKACRQRMFDFAGENGFASNQEIEADRIDEGDRLVCQGFFALGPVEMWACVAVSFEGMDQLCLMTARGETQTIVQLALPMMLSVGRLGDVD